MKDTSPYANLAADIERRSLEETNQYLNNYILKSSNNLSIILKSHLVFEKLMDEIIVLSFCKPKKLIEKKKFSDKIQILEALNLPTNVINSLTTFNTLRNKYSHKLDYEVTEEDLIKINNDIGANINLSFTEKIHGIIGMILGGLTISRDFLNTFPYLHACIYQHELFKKDIGFNFPLISARYKELGFDDFIDEWSKVCDST